MSRRHALVSLCCAVALACLCALARAADSVAWVAAASDADIEHAFAQAREARKPVLLYWGASWCPPCNQLQATLFNRQDFIERSRGFVAVHIDGDLPGAQKLGQRFKVRGYPTLVLMRGDGTEITRLPGEVDAPQVLALLQLGLAGGRPVRAVLADARAGKALPASEWTALAFYSWDTDEQQLASEAERPGLLAQLAAACPASPAQTRLWLKALAASDDGKGIKADAALRRKVLGVLADPAAARAQMDVLTGAAAEITRAITTREVGGERSAVVAAYDRALVRLEGDAGLSRADRLGALIARVDLARLDRPDEEDAAPLRLAPALLADVRGHVARDDREISNGYERQAVITAGAYLLVRAGLPAESDALLEANLAKSHSPYYLMSALASNARRRGDTKAALGWYERAFDASVGPATRLQWGASYVSALVELAPADEARIERAASKVFAEAAAQPNAFYERSARSLQRIGKRLASWSAEGRHAEAMSRLKRQLDAICAGLDAGDAQRAVCEKVLLAG